MASVSINGTVYSGNNVSIQNGEVYVDNIKQTQKHSKTIVIKIAGDVDRLLVDACNTIDIIGQVGTLKTLSGDVRADEILGDCETMSGDIDAGSIAGNCKTMSGDITT